MADGKKRQLNWSDGEVNLLLHSYSDNLTDLRRCKRNKSSYEKMSASLCEYGFQRSSSEVQKKMQNLLRKYREEKIKIGPSGGMPSQWSFFAKIHGIVGSLPSQNSAQLMVESLVGENIEIYVSNEKNDHTLDILPDSEECLDCPATMVEVHVEDQPSTSILDQPSTSILDQPSTSMLDQPSTSKCLFGSQKKRKRAADALVNVKRKNVILKEFVDEMKLAREQSAAVDAQIVKLMAASNENDQRMLALMKEQNELLKLIVQK